MQYQWKIVSAVKCYQNVFKLRKVHLKTRNRGYPIILFNEIIEKLLIKVTFVKSTPITGIAKEIAMIHHNISLLIRHGGSHWFYWSVDLKNFKQNRKIIKKSKKVPPSCFTWLIEPLFRTASTFWIWFNGNSTIASCRLRSFLNDLNPNLEKNILVFSKSNSQKMQFLCSFPKKGFSLILYLRLSFNTL